MSKLKLYSFVNPTKIKSYSGTPFFLIEYLKRFNVCVDPIMGYVETKIYKIARIFYAITRIFLGQVPKGFQYSRLALRLSLPLFFKKSDYRTIISLYQVVPKKLLSDDILLYFFIDQTLEQLFKSYSDFTDLSNQTKINIIKRERSCYQRAQVIIVNSSYAAKSLHDKYGISNNAIRIITQGANYNWEFIENINRTRIQKTGRNESLIFTFVGMDYIRKGLSRTIDIIKTIRSFGLNATLIVIGPSKWPVELIKYNWIEFFGMLDKYRDLEVLHGCMIKTDVGILLSHAEAGGIAVREFQAFGIPIIVSNVGGIVDQISSFNSSLLIDPKDDNVSIARQISLWIGSSLVLNELTRHAVADSTKSTWSPRVEELLRVLSYEK